MARFKFQSDGIDEYVKALNTLQDKSLGCIKRAVYEGAKPIGDAILGAIAELPEMDERFIPGDKPLTGITQKQKQGLLSSFGFAKMETVGGNTNTKAGFDGYNDVMTKKFPRGQPNAMIANAVNSGTSRRRKIPFVGKAIKSSESKAVTAMEKQLEQDIMKIMKE